MSIFWNMHEFVTYKSSTRSILQVVQNQISWLFFSRYVFLLQINSVAHLFLSPCCHKPCSGNSSSSRYVSNLSSSTISSLTPLFGFISIRGFVLFIFYAMLFRFLTQISDTFSGSWSSWTSMGLNIFFANYLPKASTKDICVHLYFVVVLWMSGFCFQ